MTSHLIPEPEEKTSELLRDLTANDIMYAIRDPLTKRKKLYAKTVFAKSNSVEYMLTSASGELG
jgi:hypothetical protein